MPDCSSGETLTLPGAIFILRPRAWFREVSTREEKNVQQRYHDARGVSQYVTDALALLLIYAIQ
jgi:hypothetical protein